MSVSRVARQKLDPHVCVACDGSFVYPEFGIQEGLRWRVFVRCGSCGWSGNRILDDKALEKFERELDHELEELQRDLERLTRDNMSDYCDRFVAALAANAVLPEDF
jgi:hypothetical protein